MASVPVTEMDAVTVLPFPTVLSAKVAVAVTVSASPATLSSAVVTAAEFVRSYCLPPPEIVTVRVRAVMFAVVLPVVGVV